MNNYEKTIGEALKKVLTEEIGSEKERPNSIYVSLFLLLQGLISKETAKKIDVNIFYTYFYSAHNDIHEELYEDYISKMITDDYVFGEKFGKVRSDELYDILSMDLNPWKVDDMWLSLLKGFEPNIAVKGDYVYFADKSGLKRVRKDAICKTENEVITDYKFEILEEMSHINEIVGDNDNILYVKDANDTEHFYSFNVNNDSIVRHEGNIVGVSNKNAILIKTGDVYAFDGNEEHLILRKSEYETVWIDNDRIVVNYRPEKIGKAPYYIATDGNKESIDEHTLYKYWWEYVVRRLYSKANNTEQTIHLKNHPSQRSCSVIYGPWQLIPPEMSKNSIIKKINDITAHRPDNRNIRLFEEVLTYAEGQNSEGNLFEVMWSLMVNDKGEKHNNGIFSEDYVKSLIQRNIQAEEYSIDKMRGNMETTVHKMHLATEPFEKIKSGIKTIELRVYDEKRQKLKIFDDIIFKCDNSGEEIGFTIVGLYIFPNFETLYAKLPLLKCGYTEETVATASPNDMKKYYSDDILNKYNVVGIELRRKEVGEIYSDQLQRKIKEKSVNTH